MKSSSTNHATESVFQLEDDEETPHQGNAVTARPNAQENSTQHTSDEKNAVEKLVAPRQVNEATLS